MWYLVLFISVYTQKKICQFHTRRFIFAAGSIVMVSWIQSMLLCSFFISTWYHGGGVEVYAQQHRSCTLSYILRLKCMKHWWNLQAEFPNVGRKSSSPFSNPVSILFYNFSAKAVLCSWNYSMFRKIPARLSGFSRPVTSIRHVEPFCGNPQVCAVTFFHLNNLCGWPCYSDHFVPIMLASDQTVPLAVRLVLASHTLSQ